jgi:hypothetical protein
MAAVSKTLAIQLAESKPALATADVLLLLHAALKLLPATTVVIQVVA